MMQRQRRRVPAFCPPGFLGRYTVVPGDTMFELAQFFRVNLRDLIRANPHITDPDELFPGDILCVPGLVAFPCCVVMRINFELPLPPGTGGTALVNVAPRGGEAVTFAAVLPEPSFFGDFDTYLATVFIPDVGGFGTNLFPTPEDPPTWAGRVEIPTAARLTPDSRVVVEVFRSGDEETGTPGVTGPTVLRVSLRRCRCGLLSMME